MYKLWMFDFDNTIARLEPEVDWAGGRPILESYLRSIGAPDELFARIPRGNLPLYDAYEMLTTLKKSGARLAIVTSNSSKTVKRWFHLNSVSPVEAIVGRDTLLGLKP